MLEDQDFADLDDSMNELVEEDNEDFFDHLQEEGEFYRSISDL